MRRALVLGSGGQTAIGWEVGALEGLAAAGAPIDEWDLVVGTSAGSVVGSWLAAGRLRAVYEELASASPTIDRTAMASGLGSWLPYLLSVPGPAGRALVTAWTLDAIVRRLAGAARLRGVWSLPATVAALGRYLGPDGLTAAELAALAPVSVGQRQRQLPGWEAYCDARLGPETGWPATRLRVVAFCTSTRGPRVFEALDDIPLARAIAASTAVPGIIGAVEIDGRHYLDHGPHDSTSLRLAAGFDQVLVLAPSPHPGELGAGVRRLAAIGARVTVVEPSDKAPLGEGVQRLDPMRVPAALAMGLRDGREAASRFQLS